MYLPCTPVSVQTVNPSVQNSGGDTFLYSLPGTHVNEQETPVVQARWGPGEMDSGKGTGSTGVVWEHHENSDNFLTKEPPVLLWPPFKLLVSF